MEVQQTNEILSINDNPDPKIMKEKMKKMIHAVAFEYYFIHACKLLQLPKVLGFTMLRNGKSHNDARYVGFCLYPLYGSEKEKIKTQDFIDYKDYKSEKTCNTAFMHSSYNCVIYLDGKQTPAELKNLETEMTKLLKSSRSSLLQKGVDKSYFSDIWNETHWIQKRHMITLDNYQEFIGDMTGDLSRKSLAEKQIIITNLETPSKTKKQKVL